MRKTLYIIYIPLLLIEWTVDLIGKIWNVLHNSVKTLALATENIINEPDRATPTNETGANAA
jgi:hypothetical protein